MLLYETVSSELPLNGCMTSFFAEEEKGKKGREKVEEGGEIRRKRKNKNKFRFDQIFEDFIHIFVESQSHTLKIANYMHT